MSIAALALVLYIYLLYIPVIIAWSTPKILVQPRWLKLLISNNLVLSTVGIAFGGAPVQAKLSPAPWSNQILYEVLKEAPPTAQTPKVGDMIAIRFKASYNGRVFDDTFKTEETFYYRCGVGSIVQGLDDMVLHMKEGETVHAQFGGELGFGSKGLPAAPGRPRIPPNAVLDYEVELSRVPGAKEADIVADE